MVSLVLDVVWVDASHRSMCICVCVCACVLCVWCVCGGCCVLLMDGMNSGQDHPGPFVEDVWMVSLVLDVVYVGVSHRSMCICVCMCVVCVCEGALCFV